MRFWRMFVVIAVGGAFTSSALAQSAAPSAARPAEPQISEATLTTAGYGDWQFRCQQLRNNGATTRSCEVGQTVMQKNVAGPLLQFAVGRAKAGDPMRVNVVMPVDVSLRAGVAVGVGEKDPHPFVLGWERCGGGGCFASHELSDDAQKLWRGAQQGYVFYKNAQGQDVVVPISFKGFAQALDALAKEK